MIKWEYDKGAGMALAYELDDVAMVLLLTHREVMDEEEDDKTPLK